MMEKERERDIARQRSSCFLDKACNCDTHGVLIIDLQKHPSNDGFHFVSLNKWYNPLQRDDLHKVKVAF